MEEKEEELAGEEEGWKDIRVQRINGRLENKV